MVLVTVALSEFTITVINTIRKWITNKTPCPPPEMMSLNHIILPDHEVRVVEVKDDFSMFNEEAEVEAEVEVEPEVEVEAGTTEKQDTKECTSPQVTIAYQYMNGDYYEGEFRNGVIHGYGLFLEHTGNRYEGHFENNQPHGRGTLRFKNKTYDGFFVEGIYIGISMV